jgi:two-component system, cell cycle response regulator CpdR
MEDNMRSQTTEPVITPLKRLANSIRRILVAEDDDDIRRLNTEVLSGDGYYVDAAADGAIAWDTLQRNSYHLLITDNIMPKMSGVDLLKKLYAADMTVPVIMATGKLPHVEFNLYPWVRPIAILLKPYTPEEMLRTVEYVLRPPFGGP